MNSMSISRRNATGSSRRSEASPCRTPASRGRGKVIAQDRPTSENFSMPEISIKTGDVDFILPLDEIAPKLIELVERGVHSASPLVRPKSSKLAAPSGQRGLKRPQGRAPARHTALCSRNQSGHDQALEISA